MARSWTGFVLGLLLLATAGACGDDKKPTGASCNVATANFCMDINGILPGDDTACTGQGGVWSTSAACPTANLVGTCTVTNPGAAQTIAVRFYTPIWNDTNAGTTCTSMGGTYTP